MEESQNIGFNYTSLDATNQDILLTFTPDSSTIRYHYQIFKDQVLWDTVEVDTNEVSEILLDQTGIYTIEVVEDQRNGRYNTTRSGSYIIDKEKPVIEFQQDYLKMEKGTTLYPLEGVRVYDEQDGDLLDQVTTNYEEIDFDEVGLKRLTYTVSDQAGNTTTKSMNIQVVNSHTVGIMAIQSTIIIGLIIVLVLVLFFRRSMRLEKRIAKYSIEPIKDPSLSLFDHYNLRYRSVLSHVSQVISKSIFLQKYSKRYEKYVGVISANQTGMDFISNKILVAVLFLLIAIFSKTIQLQLISIYEFCFPLILGFFAPDIMYVTKYKAHRNRTENDLLQAIIVMNNAFKSGRSITQAIHLVTTELDGAIAEEFKKMSLELSFGLSIDVVFKRFAERIQIEEVAYLTASLSILNKTGGNIIKVFSSIEKSLFDKKKLRLELNSLIGGSKIILYVLFCVPFLFILFISMISPDYFVPFFTSGLGILLLCSMVLYYIVYIVIVRRIMKVRM